MDGIIPRVRFAIKDKLVRRMRGCRDAKLKTRYLIIVNLIHGRSPSETAASVGVARSTVYRVAARFCEAGEWGLLDRREDNGGCKLDERFVAELHAVVRRSPEAFGWKRPTWTREMLVTTMRQRVGVKVHVGTMSRALRMIGARRGRPRPTVRCPWSKRNKNRRIQLIRKMLKSLPKRHVAVYQDEVDIHLNPKIGLDWMARGQQKIVLTPGQNEKRYLAGALDAVTGELTWVEGHRKNSDLFIALLWKLADAYAEAKVIHIILDNYRIHSSLITKEAVEQLGGRIVLHFLPPYCPQENKIERLWLDLHANVTRNHRCRSMNNLMRRVRGFMQRRSSSACKRYLREAA